MRPPEPRSRTVSPALSWARAVGLPQPREARIASSGICPVSLASYRLAVIGSLDPQQELPPEVTRKAACPYFSLTISLVSMVLPPYVYLQRVIIAAGLLAFVLVLHSPHRKTRN